MTTRMVAVEVGAIPIRMIAKKTVVVVTPAAIVEVVVNEVAHKVVVMTIKVVTLEAVVTLVATQVVEVEVGVAVEAMMMKGVTLVVEVVIVVAVAMMTKSVERANPVRMIIATPVGPMRREVKAMLVDPEVEAIIVKKVVKATIVGVNKVVVTVRVILVVVLRVAKAILVAMTIKKQSNFPFRHGRSQTRSPGVYCKTVYRDLTPNHTPFVFPIQGVYTYKI